MSDFPERLRLRDTRLFDDLGGAGQRIFTTAGQGYEKQEYVRADVHDAEIESANADGEAYAEIAGQNQDEIERLKELLGAARDDMADIVSKIDAALAGKEDNP